MPETFDEFVAYEVQIACNTVQMVNDQVFDEGDIITSRKAGGTSLGVGMKEMHRTIWLLMDGLDSSEMDKLTEEGEGGPRRYCIPFDRIKDRYPDFDLDAARNPDEIYQPAILIDEDTGLYLEEGGVALSVIGLVLDKDTGRYL